MIRETITFTFEDEDQQRRFREMLTRGPDGYRDIDQTQREEIARLRADDEHSFQRLTRMEAALREAERFMDYFANDRTSFIGPGTPKSCLEMIRSALKG